MPANPERLRTFQSLFWGYFKAAVLTLALCCAPAYGQSAEQIIEDIQALKDRQQRPEVEPRRGPSAADLAREELRRNRAIAVEHNDKGIDAYGRGEWAQAAEQFRIAYRHDPESSVMLDNLVNATHQVGLLAMARGDWDYAATNFQSALLHRPNSEEFRGLYAAAQQKLREQTQLYESRRAAYQQNDLGHLASVRGDWTTAEAYFKAAVQSNPAEPLYRENLVIAQLNLGIQAKAEGNDVAALAFFKSALETDPKSEIARRNVSGIQLLLSRKAAVTTVRTNVDYLVGDLGSANATAGLGYGDLPITPFSTDKPTPLLRPTEPRSVGTNTVAGDQLLCAATTAAAGGDLTGNYDAGGVACTGSLLSPGTRSRAPALDMSGFSERARNDPKVIALAGNVAALRDKSDQLETERAQLATQRNLAADQLTMNELSAALARKDQEYQTNLVAIVNQTEAVQRERRAVDNRVADGPRPAPPEPPR